MENSQEKFTGHSLIYWCQAIIFQKKKSVCKAGILLSSSFDSSIQPNICNLKISELDEETITTKILASPGAKQ